MVCLILHLIHQKKIKIAPTVIFNSLCELCSSFYYLYRKFSLCCFILCDKDGILLLEINRMLRAGGYFAWAAQPVYKHEPALEEQWTGNILLICFE